MTTKTPPSQKSDASSKSPTSEKKKPKFSIKRQSNIPEPLKNAGEQREACQACGLYKRCGDKGFHSPRVPEGWTGKLLVVATGNEDGATRKLTRSLWRKAGYEDEDIAVVSAVRCSTARSISMVQIRACRPFLLKVIRTLKPERIIGLGKVALRALRNAGEENITKNRGKAIRVPGL